MTGTLLQAALPHLRATVANLSADQTQLLRSLAAMPEPERSVVLDAIAIVIDERENVTCRMCEQPLARISGHWRHLPNGNAGCRAATFDPQGGWDDTVPKAWRASPTEPRCVQGTCRHRLCQERRAGRT